MRKAGGSRGGRPASSRFGKSNPDSAWASKTTTPPAGESVTGYWSVRRRKDRTPVEVMIGAAPVSPRVAAW